LTSSLYAPAVRAGASTGQGRSEEGVARNLREPSEVAVEGEDLVHTVLERQRDQVRGVNQIARHPAFLEHHEQAFALLAGLSEAPTLFVSSAITRAPSARTACRDP
jgi:hypothetical protein